MLPAEFLVFPPHVSPIYVALHPKPRFVIDFFYLAKFSGSCGPAITADTVLVLSKLKKNRNGTVTATHRFKVFCDI